MKNKKNRTLCARTVLPPTQFQRMIRARWLGARLCRQTLVSQSSECCRQSSIIYPEKRVACIKGKKKSVNSLDDNDEDDSLVGGKEQRRSSRETAVQCVLVEYYVFNCCLVVSFIACWSQLLSNACPNPKPISRECARANISVCDHLANITCWDSFGANKKERTKHSREVRFQARKCERSWSRGLR